MPTITSVKLQDHLRVYSADRPQAFRYSFAFSSTLADDADDIELFDIPAGMALFATGLNVSATLGASCTLTLRADTSALTAKTTAGGASTVIQSLVDVPSTSVRTVNVLVDDADIAAGATVTVSGIIAPVASVTAPVDTVE